MRNSTRFSPRWAIPSLLLVSCLMLLSVSRAVRQGEAKDVATPAVKSVAAASATMQADPSIFGSWSGVIPMRDVPVHISALPDGRLLYWGRDKFADGWDAQGGCNTFLWDKYYPELDSTQLVRNNTTNLFCSGHSFLQDGSLIVTGGHKRHQDPARPQVEGVGEEDLNVFDYRTVQWTLLPNQMPFGRWYPRNLTLANGETIFVSGSYSNAQGSARMNQTPDIFGLDGTLRQSTPDPLNPSIFSTYPFIHLTPDGRVINAGAFGDTFTRFLNVATGVWNFGPEATGPHGVGTSTTYGQGRVMVVGGRDIGDLASARAEVIDLNGAQPTQVWDDVSPMNHPRIHPTAALLPDGKVLVAGGTRCRGANNLTFTSPDPAQNCTNGQVLTPEIWDPASNVWTQTSSHQEIRVYHSTAILLPDARVMVAGGGLPAAAGENTNGVEAKLFGHKNAEIFSPPYLFEPGGAPVRRPAIVSAPAAATYGQQFFVGVGDVNPGTDVDKVVLVRLPSVTHGFNHDQRRVVLNFVPSPNGQGLNVTAPASGVECPPGPYMMFLLKRNGRSTPSVAKIIRIGNLSLNANDEAFGSGRVSSDGDEIPIASINVTAATGLNWVATVSPGAPWLSITSGSTGTGSGTVNFMVMPNSSAGAVRRSGKITVSVPGQKYTAHEYIVYQAAEFTDVPLSHQFRPFISKIYARGITNGCGTGVYCPGATVTRGQMAVFLATAMKISNLPSPLAATFSDVPPSHPFYKFVEAIARRGITGGCGNGAYCPDSLITRGQMAVFLMKAIELSDPPAPSTPTFADVQPSHPFYKWIEELSRRGITGGCGGGNFCPDTPVTRGEMAVFLSQTFNL